jgi:hypothetical protein
MFLGKSQKPSFHLTDASLGVHKTIIKGRQAPLSGKGGSSARRIALGRHDDRERTSKTHSLLYQKSIKHSLGKDQEETPLGTMGKHSPGKDQKETPLGTMGKHSPGKGAEETPLGTMGKHSPGKGAAILWSGIEQNRTEQNKVESAQECTVSQERKSLK